ncbi:XXYS1_4_G0042960.mRNA.1.CDS.1 [Saccharomyces cerevisiae]|nr:XXYS1_4_G0042960.mRNA.1.CDS.1 [Saccharomyces cerevisiae]
MTSLDDTIISYQNLMLLDNMTNYNKPSIDYFHHKFNGARLEMPASWTLLLKMRKHKLLRLPSCSSEDTLDYNMYLVRLHHCLWRRWSIDHYGLQNSKSDPLSINWNKETDITVLYGPDLTTICSIEDKMWPTQDEDNQKQLARNLKSALKKSGECWIDDEIRTHLLSSTNVPPALKYPQQMKILGVSSTRRRYTYPGN